MYRSCTIAVALFLALAMSMPRSFGLDANKSYSPNSSHWVGVTYGKRGASAKFHGRNGVVTVFSNIPLPGAVGIAWLDNDLAQLSASCGTGCGATYFVSSKGASGPFPMVLSADPRTHVFAYVRDTVITISTIEPPVRVLATLAAPTWCATLSCNFRDSYAGGRYTFEADGHEASVPLTKSD